MRNLIVAASLLFATGANAEPVISAGQIGVGDARPAYQVEQVSYRGWHRWGHRYGYPQRWGYHRYGYPYGWGHHRHWYSHRAWGHRWRPDRGYYWNDGPYYSPYYRSYRGWRRPYWGLGPYWGGSHYYRPGLTLEFGWP